MVKNRRTKETGVIELAPVPIQPGTGHMYAHRNGVFTSFSQWPSSQTYCDPRVLSNSFLVRYIYHLTALPYFFQVCIAYHVVYRLVLWPRYFSPLRSVPTPPGAKLLVGHWHNRGTGIPQREWVKQLGPVIRLLGPIGAASSPNPRVRIWSL